MLDAMTTLFIFSKNSVACIRNYPLFLVSPQRRFLASGSTSLYFDLFINRANEIITIFALVAFGDDFLLVQTFP